MSELYYKFTVECVDVCQTSARDYLEMEDKACLQNCGYNRMYMNKIFIDNQIAANLAGARHHMHT